jgi:hypothetical protein
MARPLEHVDGFTAHLGLGGGDGLSKNWPYPYQALDSGSISSLSRDISARRSYGF